MQEVMEKISMERYPAYKDSGVEWLGEIPEHWEILRGKWLFVKQERPVRNTDEIVTCFRDGQVTLRTNRKTEGFTNALKEHGYQGIRKDDLVIHAMDAFAGAIGVSDSDGKATPVYSACTPRKVGKVNPYYYAYFLRDLALSGFIQSLAKGIRERSTDFRYSDFGDLLLSVPPIEEQTAIANFLDRKTAQIDKAIAQKEKLIELLKERRQILIHKAVTHGLDENVRMKDSGVEWIGEIPEHWNKSSLRWISRRYAGGTPDKANLKFWENGTIPWIASGEVNQEKVKVPTTYITESGFLNSSARWIPKDSLIVALAGQGKTKGMVAYLEIDTTGNQSLAAIIPNKEKISSNYLFYFLKAAYHELRGVSGEGQRDGLNLQTLGDLIVCLPEVHEQKNIVRTIEKLGNKIERVISIKNKEIVKLKEYKATLINAAVTGKIKVC